MKNILRTTVLAALMILPLAISFASGKNFESATYSDTIAFYHSTSVDCNDHN